MKLITNNKIKYPLVILLALSIIAGGFYYFFNKDVEEAAAWFNDDWSYRQAVPITNSGTALTDYQVSFTLNTSTLISAGKMQADCDDLRVADAQGNVLPYWIEENNPGCNQTATRIWTKLPSIPVTTINIFVYYGNTQASSLQKGSDVFTFFDDFNGAVVDANKWTVNRGSFNIASGKLQAHPSGAGDNMEPDLSANGQSAWTDYIVETRMYSVTQSGSEPYPFVGVRTGNINPASTTAWFAEWGTGYAQGTIRPVINNTDAGWWQTWADTWTVNTWYKVKVIARGTNMDVYKDDSLKKTQDMSTQNSATGGISLGVHKAAADNSLYYDYVFTHNYAATEPTIGSLGSEEKGGGPIAYWKFDEGQGTTVNDSTTSSYNGSFSGSPTWQSEENCVTGKCLKFPADSDYVTVAAPASNALNFGASDFSISTWIKVFQPTTFGSGLFGNYNHAGQNGDMVVGISDDRATLFLSHTNTAGASQSFGFTYTPYFGQWVHMAWVKSGSTMNLYLNGQLAQSWAITIVFDVNYTDDLYFIGMTGWSPGVMTNLMVDDHKIYNYARSASQIKADYGSSKSGASSAQGANVTLGTKSQKWLSDGLVGYWKMDETATPAVDSSGNSNTGTWANAPAAIAGKFGNAIDIPGVGGSGVGPVVNVNDSDSLDVGYTNSATVSFWLKNDSSVCAAIIKKMGMWEIYRCSSAITIRFDGANPTDYYGSASLTNGQWYFVTLTRNYQTGRTVLYLNGQKDNEWTFSLGAPNTTGALGIGAYSGGNWAIDGALDEVRIYSRELSAQEVVDLYNWAPGPIAYWKLDENTGTSVSDSSGNGLNSASFNGSPTWTPGNRGSALNFTGANTVNFTYAKTMPALSMSAWVYPTNYAGWRAIIQTANTGDRALYLNNGNLQFYSACNASKTVPLNTWTHVAVTVDSADLVRYYVNGIAAGSCTSSSSPRVIEYFHLSGVSTGDSENFQGKIDDAKIYDYVRTPKQVMEDMSTGISKPIGWWQFDEGQGTTVLDSSGYGHNGATNGTWVTTGKFGKALSYNGSTSSSLGTSTDYDSSSFSISQWIKINAWSGQLTSSGNGNIIMGREIYTTSGFRYGIASDTGAVSFWCSQSGGTLSLNSGSSVVTTGQYYHLVVTYDGAIGRMYINGKLVSTNTGTYVPSVGSTLGIVSGIGGVYYPQATIDEIKYYNYALTDSDVANDYNQGGAAKLGAGTEAGDTGTAPVGWWKLDDNTGTTVVDSSGNGYNASLTGSSWVPGQLGSALKFSGTTDKAQTSNTVLTGTGDFTVEAWINRSVSGTTDYITGNYGSGCTDGLEFYIVADKLYVYISGNVVGSTTINVNTWYHVVATRTSGVIKLYVNGKQDGTGTLAASIGGSCNWVIGNGPNYTSERFEGKIDDVKVFNYARTQAQVSYDYNRGKPVGYWALNEGDGNIAGDFSGNGNNGTLTNMDPVNDDPTSGMLSQSGLISFTAANAVDNNTGNYAWHTDTSVAGSYLQVDLGSGVSKSYIKTRIYAAAGGYAGNYSVQYSDDGSAWSVAATNFIPSSAGWNEKTWGNVGDHRYWRLYLTNTPGGGSWLDELEFYSSNWSAGKYGKSLNFDGVNDYVIVNSSAYRFDSGDFTASVWASATVLDGTYDGLLTTDTSGDSAWKITRQQGNSFFDAKYNGTALSFPAVNINEWHAYTMTKSGTTLSIYMDGKFITSGTCPSTHPVVSTALVVGSYRINDAPAGNHMFNGKMDDIRLYNYALTATQVQQAILEGGAVRF